MAEIYVIGNGVVCLTWSEYYDHCMKNNLPLEYTPPQPTRV